MQSETVPQSMKRAAHDQLGCGILCPDSCHQRTSAFGCAIVGHQSSLYRGYDNDIRSIRGQQVAIGKSKKKKVISYLYQRWLDDDLPEGIAYRTDVTNAIKATGADLSVGNAANFLKDMIRKKNAVENWPDELIAARVSARQRYGNERVLQFFTYPEEWPSPFPDFHAPDNDTPIYTSQSVSIDALARSLGRSEESWLTQIAVNLNLVQTQLALFSIPTLRGRLRDVRHLQMSIKTQPEIDAAFVATYKTESVGVHDNVFITLEAKQRDERILIDQIREQVAKAFEITAHLNDPPIHAVKALALQVVKWKVNTKHENMIFLVEFQRISRSEFNANYGVTMDSELIYSMKMEEVSATLYRLEPAIPALGS